MIIKYREYTENWFSAKRFKRTYRNTYRARFVTIVNGYLFTHRKHGPASFTLNGFSYVKLDMFHRKDGPSQKLGTNINWYFEDLGYSEEEYWNK